MSSKKKTEKPKIEALLKSSYYLKNEKQIMCKFFSKYLIKQCICYLFLISSLSIYTQNQEENKNSISVNFGYQSGVLNDANFSPLNYNLNGSNYTLEYVRYGSHKKHILCMQVNAGFNTLSTNASGFFDTDIIQVQLGVFYVKRLNQITSESTFYLGGQFRSQVKSLDWENTESFSYLATHSLGIKGLYQYRITKKIVFKASIYCPFISLLARPPYNGIDEEIIDNQDNALALITNGTIESLNAYFELETELNLTYILTNSLAIKANILFNYNTINKRNKWTQFQILTNAGLAYNF
ncbi:hypothetical protein [Algibacter sp. R77976]|uniref:hypothetical protein n=1 Tax=Algibacter sp. R77976 TaxID=3093873 RepID=UPI0037C7B269